MNFWCAYCRRFLREGPPYEDFSPSHGVCDPCSRVGPDFNSVTQAEIQNLIHFHESLRKTSKTRDIPASIQLIEQGLEQGLRAVDLLMGALTPVIYEASTNPNSQINTNDRPTLAEFCAKVVEATRKGLPSTHASKSSVDVFLVATTANQHTIGPQLLELWLNAEGISAQAILNKSGKEVLAAVRQIRPKVVGFSISDARQVNEILAIADQIKLQLEPTPLMLLGGHPVKLGLLTDMNTGNLTLVMDESKLFLILKTHLSFGFLYDLKK